MKYYIVLLLVLMTASSKAQITLEHVYASSADNHGLVQVDSGIFKYVFYNNLDSIMIYNLDHSLDRAIILPIVFDSLTGYSLGNISKRLFDPNDMYECLINIYRTHSNGISIYRDNGEIIFGCESCQLSNTNPYGFQNYGTGLPQGITNTEQGTKMMIDYYNGYNIVQTAVFSLPGKVPGGTAKSEVNPPSIITGSSFPVSAYPNPSGGQMRISYKLPLGESTGDLVIFTTDGVEVKRYKVGSGFNDILVEKSDLPSGSYFYKLVTEKGESEAKKLVILK